MAKFDAVTLCQQGGKLTVTSIIWGKNIQNELNSIILKILEAIVNEIKTSKQFAIILDCTPDLRHETQLSVIVRIVTLGDIPQVKEHFLCFPVAGESTVEGLASLFLKRLEELNIPFEDCRGQSYENVANMIGKNKGVQARLLLVNTRAFLSHVVPTPQIWQQIMLRKTPQMPLATLGI